MTFSSVNYIRLLMNKLFGNQRTCNILYHDEGILHGGVPARRWPPIVGKCKSCGWNPASSLPSIPARISPPPEPPPEPQCVKLPPIIPH